MRVIAVGVIVSPCLISTVVQKISQPFKFHMFVAYNFQCSDQIP